MRLMKKLTACSLITLSFLLAGEALAQRQGGGSVMQPGGARSNPQGGTNSNNGQRQPAEREQRSVLEQRDLLDRQNPQRAANAEIRTRIESRSYTFKETGQDMPYAVYVPRKYNKKKPMPLVLALHGRNVTPESIILSFGATAERGGYILVAPQGFTLNGWYGYGQYVDGLTDEETSRRSELDAMTVLEMARSEYNIDPKRIYVAGHSMGGIGAVYLAAKYPDLWAAVGALSPGITNEIPAEIGEFDAAPILIEHGEEDEIIPVDLVRTWVEGIKKLDVEAKYYEHRGGNHVAPLQGGAQRMFDFFGKHSRKEPAPNWTKAKMEAMWEP
jgi:predicted peptidase